MSFFAKPTFALGFGAFLVCGDTCLHLGDWLALPGHWTSLPFLLGELALCGLAGTLLSTSPPK